MPQLYLDAKADFTKWSAFLSDGTTPSTALSAVAETTAVRYGPDGKSVRLSGDTTGGGNLLRFALPDTDLTLYDEVRLYLRGDRPADSTTARPFYLELHLGSTALPTSAVGNTWQRYLPVYQPGSWELVRVSLAELPAAIRTAVNLVELRFVEASAPFSVIVDDLSAVHEEMIGDVEAALRDRLHNRLSLSGNAVPAVLAHASGEIPAVGGSGAPPVPCLCITPYHIQTWDLRQNAQRTRRDFVPLGYSLAPAVQHWALTYRIDAIASDRVAESRLLDFVLRTFSASAELVVCSYPLAITFVPVSPVERGQARPADSAAARVALFYQVLARQELGASEPVRAASQLLVNADYRPPLQGS
jgi:hypothetical protein